MVGSEQHSCWAGWDLRELRSSHRITAVMLMGEAATGQGCALDPDVTQVLPSIPPVVLLKQMDALADHPGNLGQDAAKSVLLHLGSGLGCALRQIWHTDRLCTWDHKNGHTLSA